MPLTRDWAAQQLSEFLAVVSSYRDETSALRGAAERAAEALDSEVGVVLSGAGVLAGVGFPKGKVPEAELVALAEAAPASSTIENLGSAQILSATVDDEVVSHILLARVGDEPFTPDDQALLRGMGRILALSLRTLRVLENERRLRAISEEQRAANQELLESLMERQRLLGKLSKIQASISHRKPLQEVLDSITEGACELLGDPVVGLRLIDPDDERFLLTRSAVGVSDSELAAIHRTPVDQGVGGRAILEDGLVVESDYQGSEAGMSVFKEHALAAAMAAPVHEDGRVVGSLVVATYEVGRHYTESEKEALLILAQHASLALTDAKTVEEMREAQRAKDMFMAMVSHELKTPLTVIMGTLRTLERHIESMDPGLRNEILKSAFQRGRDLEGLIDRLLQGASAELIDDSQEIQLPLFVAEAARGFEHSRRLDTTSIPRVKVRINEASVSRVLGILIENCLAHSPSDSEVTLGGNVDDGKLNLWVENDGELPSDDIDVLFEPFQRGTGATSEGVGLGLYIASRIAASLGGALTGQMQAGRVRFTLVVPLDSDPVRLDPETAGVSPA